MHNPILLHKRKAKIHTRFMEDRCEYKSSPMEGGMGAECLHRGVGARSAPT